MDDDLPWVGVVRNGVWQTVSIPRVGHGPAARMVDALERVDVAEISRLLAQGYPAMGLPVVLAIPTRSIPVFQMFFNYGWDINSLYTHGQPPPLAYVLDNKPLTKWFLDHGADPNAQCHLDITPMSVAVAKAPFPAIKYLFERGGSTAKGQLLWHALNRQSDDIFHVLDLLLSLGAPLNEVKYFSHRPSFCLNHFLGLCTPVHRAVDLKRADIVRFLMRRGANPHIPSTSKRTAFDEAVALGDQEILSAFGGTTHDRL